MRSDQWSLKNEWLNAFAKAFSRDTHRLVQDILIEPEGGCVVVYGDTRSYYAVQLAIQCVQTFNCDQPLFQLTRLSLKILGRPLELQLVHQRNQVQSIQPSKQLNGHRRKVSVAGKHAGSTACFR